MSKINVGLIGLGTVGGGDLKVLKDNPDICIKKIAVRDINKKRNIEGLDTSILTNDPFSIVQDSDIDVVVEVMGGVTPALDLLESAVRNGKHVVTANKELLAKHGEELFKLANEKNVVILYEAAIAGGIPIIMPIKTTLAGNKIQKIAAILNGTTNYILTKMEESDVSYEEVLKEAQKLGYAEADPTGDVEGFDSAYKITTLATIALNQRTSINKVYREGITKISADDMKFAKELGYKIKLIALAELNDKNETDVRVHPMLVPETNILSTINGVTNAVLVEGFPVGKVVFAGPGAGEMPTASSVVGDILAIQRSIDAAEPLPMMRCTHKVNANQLNIADTVNKYYISLTAVNSPGVIGTIGEICGKHKINLSSVLQKGANNKENTAQIVVITESSKESNIQDAIFELNSSDSIVKVNNLIRVME